MTLIKQNGRQVYTTPDLSQCYSQSCWFTYRTISLKILTILSCLFLNCQIYWLLKWILRSCEPISLFLKLNFYVSFWEFSLNKTGKHIFLPLGLISKSLKLILKNCLIGFFFFFFLYFDCKFQLERSIYKHWLTLTGSKPGNTFSSLVMNLRSFFRIEIQQNAIRIWYYKLNFKSNSLFQILKFVIMIFKNLF